MRSSIMLWAAPFHGLESQNEQKRSSELRNSTHLSALLLQTQFKQLFHSPAPMPSPPDRLYLQVMRQSNSRTPLSCFRQAFYLSSKKSNKGTKAILTKGSYIVRIHVRIIHVRIIHGKHSPVSHCSDLLLLT